MKRTVAFTATLLAVLCLGRQLLAQTPAESSVPIDIEVPLMPMPVQADGALHLFYEVHLTNFRRQTIELTAVEVHAGDLSGPMLASYTNQELSDRLLRPGLPNNAPDKRVIAGGMRAVVMLHLSVDDKSSLRTRLWHRLRFRQPDAPDEPETTLVSGPITISNERPVIVAPPLRNGDWLAANGASDTSEHRTAIIAVNGKARIAQRFAIDWVKFGPDGHLAHDDRSQNANWYGYGVEILAVADGTVVAIKDGILENVPLTGQFAVPITLETIAGNYVVLNLGAGRYATFAHLQPNSVRVAVGSKVRRGQVLGLVGNSGNSDAPHLHFQITDGASPLGSEGLPFVFESLQLGGTIPSLDGILRGNVWKPSPVVARKLEMPLENSIVRFP